MDIKTSLQHLQDKRRHALRMGGPDKVARQHARGRLTARERIDRLLDKDSFLEMGLLAHSAAPGMAEKTPADGVICGYGTIEGRRVAVIANDFTVLASTNAETNPKKTLQFKTQVKQKTKVPLIWLGESGGARMPDCQGSREFCSLSGGGVDTLAPAYTHLREQPFIFSAMGECYGIPDFQAALADILAHDDGTLQAPTGAGKTVIALATIAARRQPALVIVHTRELLNQWIDRIGTFLQIPKAEIGVIGSGKQIIGDRTTVALVQSLYKCAHER